MRLTSRPTPPGVKDSSASLVGTVVEFNVVRDAATAYHAAASSDMSVFRRNQAYFWHPVNSVHPWRPIAFEVDPPAATAVFESNSIEGTSGDPDGFVVDLQASGKARKLPDDRPVKLL